jgi:ATP-dependent DNA helicase RecG
MAEHAQDLNMTGLPLNMGGLDASMGGLDLSMGGLDALKPIAEPVATTRKASRATVEDTILTLCQRRPLSADELGLLLGRSSEGIRKEYLQPLKKEKRLRYQFPTRPKHPNQAYITAQED